MEATVRVDECIDRTSMVEFYINAFTHAREVAVVNAAEKDLSGDYPYIFLKDLIGYYQTEKKLMELIQCTTSNDKTFVDLSEEELHTIDKKGLYHVKTLDFYFLMDTWREDAFKSMERFGLVGSYLKKVDLDVVRKPYDNRVLSRYGIRFNLKDYYSDDPSGFFRDIRDLQKKEQMN